MPRLIEAGVMPFSTLYRVWRSRRRLVYAIARSIEPVMTSA